MANPPESGDQALLQGYDDTKEAHRVNVVAGNLDVGDIEIGAVEIKDSASDTRATIKALNALVAGDVGLAVGDPNVLAAIEALTRGAGATDASTLRVVTANDGPTVSVLGAIGDAAVGDANGSINAHTRQIAKLLAAALTVDTELPAAAALADTAANPTAPAVGAFASGFNGSTWDRISVGSRGDGANPTATGNLQVSSYQQVYNGSAFERVRTPKVFKTISTVAVGSETAIWTPTSGKKFRLMGLVLALSAATTLTFKDNTAGATIGRLLLPAGGTPVVMNLGNGILSAAANNLLTATSGAAANLDGMVWGTEE